MNRPIAIILFILAVFASACQKGPYPYISKAQVAQIDSAAHPPIKNAAFVYNGNIYYVTDFTKSVTQITTDGSAAGVVRISHDFTKFAYINYSGSITIVSNKGALITTLSQYTNVDSFDWSADDKTLYILVNSTMYYYGPPLSLPAFTYPGIPNGEPTNVISASVSIKGDFAYVVHYFDYTDGDEYELVVAPANNGKVFSYNSQEDGAGYNMDYVSFSAFNQDMVLGYGNGGASVQMEVDLFSGLKTDPDGTYPGGDSATPVYNSTLQYLVAAAASTTVNNAYIPAALWLGTPPEETAASYPDNLFIPKYASTASTFYIDWK